MKPFFNVYVSYRAHDFDHNVLDPALVQTNLAKYASDDKSSWALITGASEGIGRQFAIDIARTKMFNLAIVSRRENILEEVKKELL